MSFIAGVAVESHSTHTHAEVSMRFQWLAVGHYSVTSSSWFIFIGPVLEKSDDQCLLEMSFLHENHMQRVGLWLRLRRWCQTPIVVLFGTTKQTIGKPSGCPQWETLAKHDDCLTDCPLVQPPLAITITRTMMGGRTNGQLVGLLGGRTSGRFPSHVGLICDAATKY